MSFKHFLYICFLFGYAYNRIQIGPFNLICILQSISFSLKNKREWLFLMGHLIYIYTGCFKEWSIFYGHILEHDCINYFKQKNLYNHPILDGFKDTMCSILKIKYIYQFSRNKHYETFILNFRRFLLLSEYKCKHQVTFDKFCINLKFLASGIIKMFYVYTHAKIIIN